MANITITHPDISKQWHPTKNGDLRAENFTKGSNKKVWWLCEKECNEGCKHEWQAIIANRTKRNDKCSFCSNHSSKKLCIHESLKHTHPEIAKQWHPTKNGDLKSENFSYGSGIKVWWLCENKCSQGCIHEWQSTINDRTSGCNCPYCSIPQRLLLCFHDSIKNKYPEIAKQWHPTKNGDLKSENFSYGSSIKVWWLCQNKCSEGCIHEWQSIISNRTINNRGCPYCSIPQQLICFHDSIKNKYPEIAKQWHPTKNGVLNPENFTYGSSVNIWWLCENKCKEGCLHVWFTSISKRTTMERNCPFCSNPKKQLCVHDSILYTHPEIAKQWHPIKNGDLNPENFSYGSHQKVWWHNIDCNHIWISNISNRTLHNSNCPYCVNKTEQKLYDALIQHYIELKQQFKVEWCKNKTYLPFDFVLEEDKIIIELDGIQHFEQVSNWQSAEETHINDIYKMKCANENGYSVIRLLQTDVFYDTYDWLKELRVNIDKIKLERIIKNIYMCKDNEYAIFA